MSKDLKVAFLGDSVTEGCFELYDAGDGFDTVRDKSRVYHEQLKALWKERCGGTLENVNFGVSGENTGAVLARIGRVAESDCPVVSVCLGLNDVCGENVGLYASNLSAIFDALRSAGKKVVFLTPNMLNTYVDGRVHPRALETARLTMRLQNDGVFDAFIEQAKKVAAAFRVPVCDAYARWKKLYAEGADVTSLLANYINHPTRAMHRLFAECLYPVLREL